MDIKIKLALIAAIAVVAAGALQGPFVNSVYQDRPIVDISFGLKDILPSEELQHDGENFYVEFAMRNRGQSDGKVVVSIFGENMGISFNENGPFENTSQLDYVVFPNPEYKPGKFYVVPHEGAKRIALILTVEDNTPSSYFQELNTLIPLEITYEKSGDNYVLTDKR